MKVSQLACGLLAVPMALAFPAIMYEAAAKAAESQMKEKRCPYADTQAKEERGCPFAGTNDKVKRVNGIAPGFDAAAQYIDTTGAHAFVPPSATDLRGPCPGLNALANHNYLPHDGWASIDQFIQATNSVYGMGLDLATFLATYGSVFDGNGLAWSIGGVDKNLLEVGPLNGLLGTPGGITNSHNKYESDSSPVKGDLYQVGDDYLNQMSQFQELYSLQPNAATANYDLDVLLQFRKSRYQQSVSQNPYFFYGPFTGILVSQAAFTFIYRFMGNKSAEHPEGVLNQEVLKSFFAVTGKPGSFKYNPGYERIPDNWYKRAIGDEYTIPYFNTDVLYYASQFPEILSIGGNTGTTNSFTGVDIGNLTGGVYNAETLTQGNNLQCFVYQFLAQASPDLLNGIWLNPTSALSKLSGILSSLTSSLACPQLKSVDLAQFNQYPGYTKK